MMVYIIYLLAAMLLSGLSLLLFRSVNHGLSVNSIHQQTTRFTVGSVIAVAPLAITGGFPALHAWPLWLAAFTAVAWAVTYPLLYHLTHRAVSADYDNHIDTACGLYFFGLLSALCVVASGAPSAVAVAVASVTSLIEFALLALVLFQAVYYIMYGMCVDTDGIQIIRQTNINEVIEFSRSYPWWVTAAVAIAVAALAAGCAAVNLAYSSTGLPVWMSVAEGAAAVGIACFIFVGCRSPMARSGLVNIWRVVTDYRRRFDSYRRAAARRNASLEVERLGEPYDGPATYVMVIGESATRDYMSAFSDVDRDTTPWLSARAEADPEHFLIFPNAYSSQMYTVATLEKSLTESNQYNGIAFSDACSLIDMARKAGFRIHWYSNQGHLGAFDTPVTVVAETSDVARWTAQEISKVPYDMTLLDFLDEVDPSADNLIVLHLKGSHFNYQNRYPASEAIWPGTDNPTCYKNSVRYTDSVLKAVYERCSREFNLKAMVYFSDHGCIPTARRAPGFADFQMVRIPLFVWLSDDYAARHPVPSGALRDNRRRCFTNDLVYDLMCGLMDLRSDRFDPAQSIASPAYRFDRDTLSTLGGTVALADDPRPRGWSE